MKGDPPRSECGSCGDIVRPRLYDSPKKGLFFYVCKNYYCHHVGPTAATKEAALEAWNKERDELLAKKEP